MELDPGGGDVRHRSVGAAIGAPVVPQVADESAVVDVGCPAAAAVLRVEGVLQLGQRLAGVLDPEVGDPRPAAEVTIAAEVRDQRIVGVQGELAGTLERGHELHPFVSESLQLAVAVELVAEEVAEDQQAGMQMRRDPGEPRLVELEEALVPGLLQESRRHAPVHVGPGAVVHGSAAGGPQDPRDHAGGRGLPVGRADHDRAAIEPGCETVDRVRGHAHEQATGQGGPSAAAAAAAQTPRGLGEAALGCEQGAHGAPAG